MTASVWDWAPALLLAVALFEAPFVEALDRPSRLLIYQGVLAVSGALLGFYMATVTILLGLLDSQRSGLQHALGGGRAARIQPIFFGAIRATALALAAGTALLIVDSGSRTGNYELVSLLTVVALGAIRGTKVMVLLQLMVQIAAHEVAGERGK